MPLRLKIECIDSGSSGCSRGQDNVNASFLDEDTERAGEEREDSGEDGRAFSKQFMHTSKLQSERTPLRKQDISSEPAGNLVWQMSQKNPLILVRIASNFSTECPLGQASFDAPCVVGFGVNGDFGEPDYRSEELSR